MNQQLFEAVEPCRVCDQRSTSVLTVWRPATPMFDNRVPPRTPEDLATEWIGVLQCENTECTDNGRQVYGLVYRTGVQ